MDNVPNTMWGLIIIKKIYLLIALLVLLVGCNSAKGHEETSAKKEAESSQYKVKSLSDEEISLTLIDDEELQITLQHIVHERTGITDHISLQVKVENKKSKTFEFYLKDLKVDGKDVNSTHIWISDDEIKPNETIKTTINGYGDEELTIDEHIAGKIIINDYENNRSEIEFSEYINE